jgi:3-phosphoshikimate 1-carboxyvinyltransferase
MFDIPHLDLPPLTGAGGSVRLPGSKSISNRVLLMAGLCAGRTRVHDVLDADDTRVMIEALRTLGAGVQPQADGSVAIDGLAGSLGVREADLFLGNAGTAMRPLAAVLALLATRDGGAFTLRGVERMHERPIGDLVEALRSLGCTVHCTGRDGYPPLRLTGDGAAGALDAAASAQRPVRVRGDVSSQFLTALLLALPLIARDRDRVVEVDGPLISKPYVEITLNLMARFGVAVERDGWRRFTIAAGSEYRSPGDIHVEGDASAASYFVALGALAATDAPVRIEGVGAASIQGDIRFVDAARAMGADVRLGPNWIEARRGRWPLQAVELDCNEIPDAAMTLAVMALFADGTTRLTGIASWRVKETDRIAAMAAELERLGARVESGDDFIAVSPPATWQAASIGTYDDHRMAMCFSLAAFNALVAGAGAVPVRLLDPRCVAKTFPEYFERFFDLVQADPAQVPVVTIDGPTASGKGTLAAAVAAALGYRYLDSGALYRATALAALRSGVDVTDAVSVGSLATRLPIGFADGRVLLDGADVTDHLRREEVGVAASKVSAHASVRRALHDLQLAWRRPPGLVADGRDMGTVVFPNATLKVFLTASALTRAERRHRQLLAGGVSTTLEGLLSELQARDQRDRTRVIAPLEPAEDALMLDNSSLTIDESVARVLEWWQQRRPFQRE